MGNDKPRGYYDEIKITASKKDDLLQFLKGYDNGKDYRLMEVD
jgi:hypothetical protein